MKTKELITKKQVNEILAENEIETEFRNDFRVLVQHKAIHRQEFRWLLKHVQRYEAAFNAIVHIMTEPHRRKYFSH